MTKRGRRLSRDDFRHGCACSLEGYDAALELAKPLLEQITPEEPEYSDAVRMLNFLRFFKTVEDDSAIANNSILREFIGGSVFVD